MTETIRQAMLRQCKAVDVAQAKLLAGHPESPRYCYTCQRWLENANAEVTHNGHSIH